MHLPYMRVAIYALTFLTYAYSGHGSHMIANLRDAIIAAEAVFGDVFKNAIYVARKFQTVHEVFDAAVDENCVYKCPNGATPMRNKFHVPSADGCGSLGIGIATEYLPVTEMDNCCDEHDICYDTCNKDKELCDIEFKRCLYNYCDQYEKTAVGGDIVVTGCKGAAKMLFTTTLTLGCRSFLDAQAKACYCGAAPSGGKSGAGPAPTSSQQQQQYQTGGVGGESAKPARGFKESNRNEYKNEYKNKPRYNSEKNDGNSYNTYPNNVRQEQREQPPQYGWKDKKDL